MVGVTTASNRPADFREFSLECLRLREPFASLSDDRSAKRQCVAATVALPDDSEGNVSAAARLLGVHRSWLYRRRE